jgi:hypothetical protein
MECVFYINLAWRAAAAVVRATSVPCSECHPAYVARAAVQTAQVTRSYRQYYYTKKDQFRLHVFI